VALGLRKARRLPRNLEVLAGEAPALAVLGATATLAPEGVPEEQGVYLLQAAGVALFVGETANLRRRYERHLLAGGGGIPDWLHRHGGVVFAVAALPGASHTALKQAQLTLVHQVQPLFNVLPRKSNPRKGSPAGERSH
jgi:hypothetical protein